MPEATRFLDRQRTAESNRPAGFLSDDELEHVEENIMRFYNDGTPLYNRDNLARIAKQLQDANDGKTDIVVVNGLDGVPVEFHVAKAWGPDDVAEGKELFMKGARICYRPYDRLNWSWSTGDKICAYCSMRIMHVLGERSIVDGKERTAPMESHHKVEERFEAGRGIWQMSPECAELKKLISTAIASNKASKVVGLALGSLTRLWPAEELRHRTSVQHAMLLTIRDAIGKQSDVPCYVQDPAYTPRDIDILNGAGFTVLGDPNGLLEMDEASVVVSIAPDFALKEVLVDLAKPAIIIWMPAFDPFIEEDGTQRLCTDPEGPRVKKFLADFYDKVEFVGQKYYLGTLDVYIRRGGD